MQRATTKTKLVTLALGMLMLTGCATRERYESELQGWVGSNIKVVMDAWGYPAGSFESPTSGNLVYVWDKQNSYTSPPSMSTTVITGSRGSSFGTGFGFGFGGQTTYYRCQTYFEVDKTKTILSWKAQGNDCRK